MTTKRYRLPAEFGGGEWPGTPINGGEYVRFLPGLTGESMVLRASRLTEVPPTTPTEPDPGAWLIGDHVCVRFVAPDGYSDWAYPCLNGNRQQDWAYSDFDDMWTMLGGPEVTITRLVPESDPLPEVTLPWTYTDKQGDRVEVARAFAHGTPFVGAREGSTQSAVYLDTHEARLQAAAAILVADRLITESTPGGAS